MVFDLAYNRFTGEEELDPQDVYELLTVLALVMKSFMNAARTIPAGLFGKFFASHEPRFFIASVKVNPKRKEVRTRVNWGGDEAVNQVEKLADLRVSAT